MSHPFPACWTVEQWEKFKHDHDWLFANDGKLGCSLCREVETLGPNRSLNGTRFQLSGEWCKGQVLPNGDTRQKEHRSLRKKIYIHRDSASHQTAVSIVKTKHTEQLQTKFGDQQKQHVDTTCRVFRTVYYIAKSNRPFVDHPDLIELQAVNGVHMGRMLHSNVTATDVAEHIALEMRKKLVKAIIECKLPFSVLIDESTSLGQKSCLIVYIRCCVDECSEPTAVFLDLLELSSLTADVIVETLLDCLIGHGFSEDILAECLLGLATDGASVMLGKHAGVYTQLKAQFPNLIGWHCFNHRLELSVHDAVEACSEVNHFKIFIQKLYTLYSASPKNRRALETCAGELGVQLLKIGKILDVRWVASSFRTVRAVWVNYCALHAHFTSASSDQKLDSKERAQYKGMADKLSSTAFLLNLALMFDALEELSELSESLQADSITLPKATRLISRQIEVFLSRKQEGGDKYKVATEAVNTGMFLGVCLKQASTKTAKEINRQQFYQALSDCISVRLMADSHSALVQCVQTLLPNTWPSVVSAEYGETQLKEACRLFLVSHSSQMKNEYRDFKDSQGNDIGPSLRRLLNSIRSLPISTAECERGFSRMNLICTPLRSVLTTRHISSLLFVSIVGPPLNQWNPAAYVNSWLVSGRHAATDLGKGKSAKPPDAPLGRQAVWRCM